MPEEKYTLIDWSFIFNWTLMSVAGIVIGIMAQRFFFWLIFGIAGGGFLGKLIEGALVGLALGIAQQFSLPPPLPRSVWWAGASVVGWSLGWAGGWSLGWDLGFGGFARNFAIIGGVAGLLSGVLHWRLLTYDLNWAAVWLVISPLAWAVGFWAGMSSGGAFGWPIAGATGGAITAATLLWLIHHSQPNFRQPDATPAPDPTR